MEKKDVLIFDAQSVRSIDNNGYMHVAMTNISKATVNPYLGSEIENWQERGLEPDGIYYGLRDPDELQKAAPTFNGLPLLMNHHDIDASVQPKDYIVGSTGTDARFQNPYLQNSLSITDEKAIKAVQDGTMKEISCAYFFTPEWTSGDYTEGGDKIHYDFIMRDIKGNHVALVAEGRAGHDVVVADSKKGVNDKMVKTKKNAAFEARRKNLAKDADFIKYMNDDKLKDGLTKAVDAVTNQVYGKETKGIAKDTAVDGIIGTFLPDIDGDLKTALCTLLSKLQGGDEPPEGDAQVPTQTQPTPNVPKTEPVPPVDPDDVQDDDITGGDPLDVIDKNSPAYQAGFKAGQAAAKDEANKKIKEAQQLNKDSIDKIKSEIKEQIVADTKAHYKTLNDAAIKVKPLVGTIADPLAFDSAADIFAFALKQCGKDPDKYDKAGYAGMVDMLIESKPVFSAADTKPIDKFDEQTQSIFDRLENIE